MDTPQNNQNTGTQTNDQGLEQKKYAARIEMENEKERARREAEEKEKREKEAKENAIKKAEEEKKAAAEKIIKDKEEAERKKLEETKATATKITKEVEKIKAVGAQINSLRTLKNDMDELIREQNISLARIAMEEEIKRRELGEKEVAVKSKNKIYFIISAILVLTGGLSAFYVYFNKQAAQAEQTNVIQNIINPIIYTETKKEIDLNGLSKESAKDSIKKGLFESQIESGKIEFIALVKKDTTGEKISASTAETLSIIDSAAPEELKRSLLDEINLLSVMPINGEKAGGILLKTESYQKSFAGMLKWEKGSMTKDLYELLTGKFADESITSLNFVDVVLNNQDSRVLIDLSGKSTLVYGFLNGKTIAIAGNIESFNEIVNRFRNSGIE